MKYKILTLVLSISAFLVQSAASQTYVDYYNKGQAYFENGDYQGFLKNLIQADSARPNHRVIMFNLAKAYEVNGFKQEALGVLSKLAGFYASEAILDSVNFKTLIHEEGWLGLKKLIERSVERIESSELAFEFEMKGFHPEGIEYDPQGDSFYLSDIHSGKIYKTENLGGSFEVVTDLSDKGYWSPMSIKLDPLNTDQLWVVSSAVANFSEFTDSLEGRSVLLLINKRTGAIVREYHPGEKGHLFGDLVITSKGDVYITDSQIPVVYSVASDDEALTESYRSPQWLSLQGITLSEDESRLYISDYISGIFMIDIASGEINPLINNNELLRSTDGLYRKGDKLIAIQNGTLPKRISLINLDDEGYGIESTLHTLDQAREELEEPTLGTWVNDDLYYIANSPWGYYDDNNNPQLDEWPVLKIMRLKGKDIR
jgi:tetratricopeptide (TPR) repeat protein